MRIRFKIFPSFCFREQLLNAVTMKDTLPGMISVMMIMLCSTACISKFSICTQDVKVAFFKAYSPAHLWLSCGTTCHWVDDECIKDFVCDQ